MKMNRRNVLVGLGTIVAGGGAALGTGAFSTVEADRTVNISAADDSNALISLTVSGTLAGSEGSDDEIIQFDLGDNGVNLDARTTFSQTLDVTNQGNNPVDIAILDGSDGSDVSLIGSNTTDLSFEINGDTGTGSVSGVSNGSTVTFDVVVNLTDVTDSNSTNIPSEVTITANDASQ